MNVFTFQSKRLAMHWNLLTLLKLDFSARTRGHNWFSAMRNQPFLEIVASLILVDY